MSLLKIMIELFGVRIDFFESLIGKQQTFYIISSVMRKYYASRKIVDVNLGRDISCEMQIFDTW